jgi:hypothetical protein
MYGLYDSVNVRSLLKSIPDFLEGTSVNKVVGVVSFTQAISRLVTALKINMA